MHASKGLTSSLKKIIVSMLKSIGVIEDGFTGRVVINFTQGGLQSVEKFTIMR